jgi:hypothetical protein
MNSPVSNAAEADVLLEARGITKTFPGVRALWTTCKSPCGAEGSTRSSAKTARANPR